ncbi:hypothetical protein [Shimia biformata]|uniref:hypothetical protein n=1 Tax=Shimia biformata TaxID=1294299 RepID=UPI00194DF8D8|nr:hypothetical protein [Shimia biformata]
MKLIELTDVEQRVHAYSALARHQDRLAIDRCFYISHHEHYPAFKQILVESLTKTRPHWPLGPRDVVVIDRSREAGTRFDTDQARALSEFCKTAGLPLANVVMVSQSNNLGAYYQSFREIGATQKPGWVAYHHFFQRLAEFYADMPLTDCDYDRLVDLPPRFLCTNNKLRSHRRVLVEYLLATEKTERYFLSFRMKDVFGTAANYDTFVQNHFPGFEQLLSRQHAGGAEPQEFDLDEGEAKVSYIDSYPEDPARQSILALVSESDMLPPMLRVTEKSLKPFVFFRPQIVWGPAGALTLLRQFGFRTFGNVIDESYDATVAPQNRLMQILAEMDRLYELLSDRDARQRFIADTRDICAHNQVHLQKHLIDRIQEDFVQACNFLVQRSVMGLEQPIPACDSTTGTATEIPPAARQN